MVTAEEIYSAALALIGETRQSDDSNKNVALSYLNILLVEALEIENSVRRHKGLEVLTSAPVVSNYNDEVDYADGITRVAFPFGIAAFFFRNEDDNALFDYFRRTYLGALQDAQIVIEEPIRNEIWGDCNA